MKSQNETDKSLAEEVALFRYGVIADVVRLEPGSRGLCELLRQKAQSHYTIPGSSRTQVAAETMRVWVRLYRRHGFAGLYPKMRKD